MTVQGAYILLEWITFSKHRAMNKMMFLYFNVEEELWIYYGTHDCLLENSATKTGMTEPTISFWLLLFGIELYDLHLMINSHCSKMPQLNGSFG